MFRDGRKRTIGSQRWFYGVGSFFLGAALCFLSGDSAQALQSIDQLEGVDLSFRSGYAMRSRSEAFHSEQAREFITEGESAIYTEEEAKSSEEDLWAYSRKIDGGALYVTNAKSLPHDPAGDLIYTLNSALGMARRKDYTTVNLGYTLSSTRNAQNEKSSTISHGTSVAVTYDFGRLALGISDGFSPRSVFDQGERTELIPDKAGQKKIFAFTNSLGMSSAYKFSEKTDVSFGYGNSVLYFPIENNSSSSNRNNSSSVMTHSYRPKISYKLTSKIDVFGEYAKEVADFFKGGISSSKAQTIRVGGKTTLWRNFKITGSGAYFIREYVEFGRPSTVGFLYDLSVARPLTRKLTASASVANALGENFDPAKSLDFKTDTIVTSVNLTYGLTKRLKLEGSASALFLDNGGFVSAKDEENDTQTFTRPNESDEYLLGIGLRWTPRGFLTVLVAYDMGNKKGAFKSNDITSHRFAVSGAFTF